MDTYKRSINGRIVGLSLFLLSVVAGFFMYVQPVQYANAVGVTSINLGDSSSVNLVLYNSSLDKYILNHGSNEIWLVDPVTHAKTVTTLTSPAPKSYGLEMSCPLVYCYIAKTAASGSLPQAIVQFDPLTGTVIKNFSVDTSGADINIAGIDHLATSGPAAFASGWFTGICASGSNRILLKVTGEVLGTCAGTNFGANSILNVVQSGTVVGVTTSAATNSFQIWSSTTGTRTCQVNVNVSGGGSIANYNSNWYVVVGTNTINKYDNACSAGTGISGTGISSQVYGIGAIASEGTFFVKGTTSVSFMNLTSTDISTLQYSIPTGYTDTATQLRNAYSASASEFNQLAVIVDKTGTDDPMLFIQYGELDEEEETGESGVGTSVCPALSVCFDFDEDGLIDIVKDDPDGDGIVDFGVEDIPLGSVPPKTAAEAFGTLFGMDALTSDLVFTIAIHAVVVIGIAGTFAVMTHQAPPFFVWVILMVLASGLSMAIGAMPILFFFIEVALIVGGVAALVKKGVIG